MPDIARQVTSGNDIQNGSQDNSQDNSQNKGSKEDNLSWQASYSRLENRYTLALAADHIYGCCSRDKQFLLDNVNRDDLSVNRTFVLSDASFISGMASDQEGNVYLLENKEDGARLWKVDADGSMQDGIEMELEDTEGAENLLLKGIETDESGNFCVWCERRFLK